MAKVEKNTGGLENQEDNKVAGASDGSKDALIKTQEDLIKAQQAKIEEYQKKEEAAKNKTTKAKAAEGYANAVYAEIEQPQYSPTSGKKLSTPNIQTFNRLEWEHFVKNPAGHTIVKVHHLPEGFKTAKEILASVGKK